MTEHGEGTSGTCPARQVFARRHTVKAPAGQRANIVTQVLDRTTSSAAESMRAVFTAISLSNLDPPAAGRISNYIVERLPI